MAHRSLWKLAAKITSMSHVFLVSTETLLSSYSIINIKGAKFIGFYLMPTKIALMTPTIPNTNIYLAAG